jgi:hypothetical protein
MTVTSTPAPAVANKGKPPDVVPWGQTSAVPAQPNITATPPSESPGIGRKGVLAIGVVIGMSFLAGGLVVFLLRRAR